MVDISLAQAKAQLSELVARAAAGEVVRTTKRGKPVAQITPVPAPRQPIDFAPPETSDRFPAARARTSADFIRRMRDDDRY
jgi:prevent-host-death family protein